MLVYQRVTGLIQQFMTEWWIKLRFEMDQIKLLVRKKHGLKSQMQGFQEH